MTLGIYYLTPFLRWDRGPGAPDQAVLIDFPSRRFYFFAIEIWPLGFYYITGLLIIASLVLFLMNAVAGRVPCGYLCPQTVWTTRLEDGRRRRSKFRPFAISCFGSALAWSGPTPGAGTISIFFQ